MKKLSNLGRALNKAEQKEIQGGIGPGGGSYFDFGCVNNCWDCVNVGAMFGSFNVECRRDCPGTDIRCIVYTS